MLKQRHFSKLEYATGYLRVWEIKGHELTAFPQMALVGTWKRRSQKEKGLHWLH